MRSLACSRCGARNTDPGQRPLSLFACGSCGGAPLFFPPEDDSAPVPASVFVWALVFASVVELERWSLGETVAAGWLVLGGAAISLALLVVVGLVADAREFVVRARGDRARLAMAERRLVEADAEVASLRGLLSGAIESGRDEVRAKLVPELEARKTECVTLLAVLEERTRERDTRAEELARARSGRRYPFVIGDRVRTRTHPCGLGKVSLVEGAVVTVRLDDGYEGCWGDSAVEWVELVAQRKT